jgi:hypothetical protein
MMQLRIVSSSSPPPTSCTMGLVLCHDIDGYDDGAPRLLQRPQWGLVRARHGGAGEEKRWSRVGR